MRTLTKYRGVSAGTGDVDASFSEFLIQELEWVNPNFVFVFGKLSWETLQNRLQATPVGELPASDSVLDFPGVLHATRRLLDTAVLPLSHLNPNFRGAQIANNDYVLGLASGVEQYTGEHE